MNYEEWRDILGNERLPAAVVDLDAFDRNVALFAGILRNAGHGQTLRLASKSIRVPELMSRILESGAPYRGVMCYTSEEAVYLASQGFDDILIAYPTRQTRDFVLLRAAHEAGKTIRLMVDSVDGARAVAATMNGLSHPFPLVLDIDMSLRMFGGQVHLGVRRSPIRTADAVVRYFEETRSLPGVQTVGLMGYEAQVAGLGDQNPFQGMMNAVHRLVRRRSIAEIAKLRGEIVWKLAERGHEIALFNGGGTGSAPHTVKETWLTELTVGSGFLCSHLFSYYSDVLLEPACFFVLQTVRSSDRGYITCQGGGYIASGAPGWEKVPVPHLPTGLSLVGVEGCGEVQTPLKVANGCTIRVGDPVLFRHAKAGELAEHFNEYVLVSRGKIVGRAPTYRGLGHCFLG